MLLRSRDFASLGVLDGLRSPANGATADEDITSGEFAGAFPTPKRWTRDPISVPEVARPYASGADGSRALAAFVRSIVRQPLGARMTVPP